MPTSLVIEQGNERLKNDSLISISLLFELFIFSYFYKVYVKYAKKLRPWLSVSASVSESKLECAA